MNIFFRAIVDASQFVKTEVEILEPVTIKVNLCQNMAASWFHDVPEIDIAGTMPSISVSIQNSVPVSFIKLKRTSHNYQNMTADWFHDVAEIDLASTMPSISTIN